MCGLYQYSKWTPQWPKIKHTFEQLWLVKKNLIYIIYKKTFNKDSKEYLSKVYPVQTKNMIRIFIVFL